MADNPGLGMSKSHTMLPYHALPVKRALETPGTRSGTAEERSAARGNQSKESRADHFCVNANTVNTTINTFAIVALPTERARVRD